MSLLCPFIYNYFCVEHQHVKLIVPVLSILKTVNCFDLTITMYLLKKMTLLTCQDIQLRSCSVKDYTDSLVEVSPVLMMLSVPI